MKTAMQELIEYLFSVNSDRTDINKTISIYLEKEKQQIIDAANHGANFDTSPYISANDYYEKTFKNR